MLLVLKGCKTLSSSLKVTLNLDLGGRVKRKKQSLLLANSALKQSGGAISPPGVRSTYTFTAGIRHFRNCGFGDYPALTNAYVRDWVTLDRSEPQTIRPQPQVLSMTLTLRCRRRSWTNSFCIYRFKQFLCWGLLKRFSL